LLGALVVLFAGGSRAFAQWQTQSLQLKSGWNAVFLHVDASHTTLREMTESVANSPIEEVWMWAPSPTALQFIDSPQEPVVGGSVWLYWQKAAPASGSLAFMSGNNSYLVKVASNTPTYTWNIKGRPTPFKYNWTTTGLNFVGFPSLSTQPPTLDALLAAIPDVRRVAEIYQYPGGELGTGNPARVFGLRNQAATRGQAFWIRSPGVFNRYFGPMELELPTSTGVSFRANGSQARILLRNIHPAPVTVSLNVLASEVAPTGQRAIVAAPPLLLRGALNTSTLIYSHSVFDSTPKTFTLAAQGQLGAEVEIVLGLNRSQMTAQPGDLFAGILRFTDSLGLSQLDVPVTAEMGSTSGLWIGAASVNQVQHYIKQYDKTSSGTAIVGPDGKYILTNTLTSIGQTARDFPLRLIVHNNAQGQSLLLQRAYVGLDSTTNAVITTQEGLLNKDFLSSARRISSIHLPWSEANSPWSMSGNLKQGGSLSVTVDLGYDEQASNPFLHTYHPDHDNLTANFAQKAPQGFESFGVRRRIDLQVQPPSNDFNSLTSGNQSLSGVYSETVTFNGKGTESREYNVRGTFSLSRLSDISTLTQPR